MPASLLLEGVENEKIIKRSHEDTQIIQTVCMVSLFNFPFTYSLVNTKDVESLSLNTLPCKSTSEYILGRNHTSAHIQDATKPLLRYTTPFPSHSLLKDLQP